METADNSADRNLAIERLTALWALNESGLGGILHALQIPFKGIVLTGFAVILITLTGYYSRNKFRDIMKATAIVLIIKLMVSPHTPVTAYLAVSFQGLMGALLFNYLANFRVAAFTLAFLAFMESALQRLVVLTVVFGKPLWESVNVFFDYIFRELHLIGQEETTSASYWVIGFYVGAYVMIGLMTGLFAGRIPQKLTTADLKVKYPFGETKDVDLVEKKKQSRPVWKRRKWSLLAVLFLITLILYLLSEEYQWTIGLYVFARTLFVIGIWYLVAGPLALSLIRKILRKKKKKYSVEIDKTLLYLPELRRIIAWAWKNAREEKGVRRITYFIELIFYRVLVVKDQDDIEQLT